MAKGVLLRALTKSQQPATTCAQNGPCLSNDSSSGAMLFTEPV
jgi:hypothetical protein